MRPTVRAILVALSLTTVSLDAHAAERPPGPDEPSPGAVAALESYTETARIGTAGWLQGEFAYRALLAGYADFGDELTIHQGELLLDYTASRKFQIGAGWHLFGHVNSDFSAVSGVGDPYLRGKLSLPLSEGLRPQALAIVAETRFGIGQEPATQTGFTLTLLGAYTVQLGDLEIDANAGVIVNSAQTPATLSVPLAVRGAYGPMSWLRGYVEFSETLTVDALRSSETRLGAGVSIQPTPRVVVHVGGGVGLSESLPAGVFQVGLAVQAVQASELEMDYGP